MCGSREINQIQLDTYKYNQFNGSFNRKFIVIWNHKQNEQTLSNGSGSIS